MSIALIVAVHGQTAPQLMKTAEMLLGEQQNVSCIEFLPGENVETLSVKYRECLKELNTEKGLLFLVDIWGGSPFNAAHAIAPEINFCDIVTGVNVPMLIEILMARDDDPTFKELVTTALDAGREGIKALNAVSESVSSSEKPSAAEKTSPPPAVQSSQSTSQQTGHMKIALARIDDRLIHGQVATRWTKETNVSRIIVVSDEVAVDNVRKTLLTQVAPPGVSAHVVSVDKMVRVWNNPKYARERVMLLFTNPTDVLRIVEQGVQINSVNIGGIAYREGKRQVNNAVSIDEKDIEAFKKLHAHNIELEVRKVSSDAKLQMMDLIAKTG